MRTYFWLFLGVIVVGTVLNWVEDPTNPWLISVVPLTGLPLLGVFGFVYRKHIWRRAVWKAIALATPVGHTILTALRLLNISEPSPLQDISVIIVSLVFLAWIPAFVALFVYGFRDSIWAEVRDDATPSAT